MSGPRGRMRALVRAVPDSLALGLAAVVPDPPIDVARARAQHAGYVHALRSGLSLLVEELPADESSPDCVFIEDTAVVAGGLGWIAGPVGPPGRRRPGPGTEGPERKFELATMDAPATLDGGDCLLLGGRMFVGLTARTNAAGVARATEVFARVGIQVIGVPVSGALHLKSVCSPLDEGLVLVAEGTIPAGMFTGARELVIPAAEAPAANAVAIGRTAVIAEGFPRARGIIEAAGFSVVPVDTSELRKLDGALTCLSIIFYA